MTIAANRLGALGFENFADRPGVDDVFSGISVGANRFGVLSCVSYVRATGPDAQNYDCIVEFVLNKHA